MAVKEPRDHGVFLSEMAAAPASPRSNLNDRRIDEKISLLCSFQKSKREPNL